MNFIEAMKHEDIDAVRQCPKSDLHNHCMLGGSRKHVDVMRWLERNEIRLNICPTSNVLLKRVDSLRAHPIRVLFDHGVKVTVNTDDVLVFGKSVSDEYLNLYRVGLFSAEELDTIRNCGLETNAGKA